MARAAKQFEKTFAPDDALIGKRVCKRSHKPFKSSSSIGTIKGFTTHPTLGFTCFTFNEDDSYVACYQCVLI